MPVEEPALLAPCHVVVDGPSRFFAQVKALGQPHGMRTSFVVNDQTNLLVLCPESVEAVRENNTHKLSAKVQQARKRNIPLVPLSFLHQCIDEQQLLYAPDYACTQDDSMSSSSHVTNTPHASSRPEDRPGLHAVELLEGWREAKIFLSSTFRDMHGERDYLTRFVFPELQERCEALRVHVSVIDLRWGVTQEQAENGTAVELCLNHVEECRPFFVGLLGSRYGWIPDDLPSSVYARYPWLETTCGLSVTHMEMKLAALLPTPSGHVPFQPLIYIRDEGFQRDVPPEYQEDFEAESAFAFDQLYDLKEELRESGHIQMESYPCRWLGVRDGKPMTGHLKELGQHLLEQLWAQMQDAFPAVVTSAHVTPWERQRQEHALVIEQHARSFVGRQALLQSVIDGVVSDSDRSIILAGIPGCGKTSLVAACARHITRWARQNDKHVIAHFIGNARDSTSLRLMLRRFCQELWELWNLGSPEDVPHDYNLLEEEFLRLTSKEHAATSLPVILVIDAVNQLDNAHSPWLFRWLPSSPHSSVTFLISMLGGKYYDQIRAMKDELGPYYRCMLVQELDRTESREIVESRLSKCGKSLSETQMDLLLNKADASLPIFLTLACEELRVFGVFEKLDERIQSMAGCLHDLFEEVLTRLEYDFGSVQVRALFSLLASSRQGLSVQECGHLLGIWEQPRLSGWHAVQSIATEEWQRLERGVKAYLSFSGSGDSLRITFFHEQLLFAVRREYLGASEDNVASAYGHPSSLAHKAHSKLAQYFSLLADPQQNRRWKGEARGLSELPYHSVCAQAWSSVTNSLCGLAFIEMKIQQGMMYGLLDDFGFLFTNNPPLDRNTWEQIRSYYRFLKARAHLLQRRPALTFSIAMSLPDHSWACQEAQSRWRTGTERRMHLRWVNKPQQEDPCIMTLNGHTKSIPGCAVMEHNNRIVLASASHDCNLRLWDGFTGAPDSVLPVPISGTLHCCTFSHDGTRMMVGTWNGNVVVWDVPSRQILKRLSVGRSAIDTACFTADNEHLLAGDSSGSLYRITLKDFSIQSENCGRGSMTVRLARGGAVLAVSQLEEGTISLRHPESLKPLVSGTVETRLRCSGLDWAPGDAYLAAGAGRQVMVYSVAGWTLAPYSTLAGIHKDGVVAVSFHDKEPWLLSASHDNLIVLWNYHTGEPLERFMGHTGSVLGCVFYPGEDERRFLTCSFDRTVKVWEVADSHHARSSPSQDEGHAGRLLTVACAPQGGEILTGSRDKTFKAWGPYEINKSGELSSSKAAVRWTSNVHNTNVVGCAYSSDGKKIATVDRSGVVALTATSTGESIHEFCSGESGVAFSPSGKHVAVGGSTGLWIYESAANGELVGECGEGITCVAYSPDGLKIVTGSSDGVVHLWCARQFRQLATYRGHERSVRCCAFSPDSKRIITGGEDSVVMEWSAANAQQLSTIEGHEFPVLGCGYSPDGRYIFTGSTDGMAIVWDAETREEVAAFACLGRLTCLAPYPSSQATAFVVGDGSGTHYLLQLIH